MALDLKKAIEQREKFMKEFSPDKLKGLDGRDFLYNVFPNTENDSTMADMVSTGTPDWVNVNGGSQAHWKLYDNKGTGNDKETGWKIRKEHIEETFAINYAMTIKDEIIKIADCIDKIKSKAKIDYDELYKNIEELSKNNTYVKIENGRYLKYFALVYAGMFPLFYGDEWFNPIIKKGIGSNENIDKYTTAQKLAIIVKDMQKKGKDSIEGSIAYANELIERGYQEGWAPNYLKELDKELMDNIQDKLQGTESLKSVQDALMDIYQKGLAKEEIEIEEWNLSDRDFLIKLKEKILPKLRYKSARGGKEGKPAEYARYLEYFIEVAEEKEGMKISTANANNNGSSDANNKPVFSLNQIIFGAPGTGKSHKLNENKNTYFNHTVKWKEKDGDKIKEEEQNSFERVTFHPDYYYSNFVGSYKPVMNGKDIEYKFVPGPFLRVYAKAKNNQENVLLIIEEINRANVAAVFGDVFQLLDRDEEGKSEYTIAVSEDVKKWLEDHCIKETELSIPSNMYIWATMNSADQGVFPMDTAFKRRWSFEYLGLDDGEEELNKLGNEGKKWNEFRKAINTILMEMLNVNEDKCMGPFFLKKEEIKKWGGSDFKEIFKSKVLMYLFEDAVKHKRAELFNGKIFSKICDEYSNDKDIFNDKNLNDKLYGRE